MVDYIYLIYVYELHKKKIKDTINIKKTPERLITKIKHDDIDLTKSIFENQTDLSC
jgi:hypothetical protein